VIFCFHLWSHDATLHPPTIRRQYTRYDSEHDEHVWRKRKSGRGGSKKKRAVNVTEGNLETTREWLKENTEVKRRERKYIYRDKIVRMQGGSASGATGKHATAGTLA
jgi:hypothetical protein